VQPSGTPPSQSDKSCENKGNTIPENRKIISVEKKFFIITKKNWVLMQANVMDFEEKKSLRPKILYIELKPEIKISNDECRIFGNWIH
jgi:hypothetical protein